jgi:hypothetical protein
LTCRAPWGQIAEAVRRLDTRILTGADDARAVLACAPAAEERKMFEAFLRSGGALAALSDTERFCLELMQVGTSSCRCVSTCERRRTAEAAP